MSDLAFQATPSGGTTDHARLRNLTQGNPHPQYSTAGHVHGDLANPPSCRVFNSVAISHATTATWQALTFDSERRDTDTMHSTVSNTGRITFTTAGLYLVGACVEFTPHTAGVRVLRIVHSVGATPIGGGRVPASPGAHSAQVDATTLFAFGAGAYVTLEAYQDSGGALDMLALTDTSPVFWALLVSL